MRFSIAIFAPIFLAGIALAGSNCKCQDDRGQFDAATQTCCGRQSDIFATYHGDQHHQCSSATGGLDSGAFVTCCQTQGVNTAFCWT